MENQTFLWFLEKEEVANFFSLAELMDIQLTRLIHKHCRKGSNCLKNKYNNKAVFVKKGKLEIVKESIINGEKKQLTIGIIYAGSIWSFNQRSNFNHLNQKSTASQRDTTYLIKVLKESELLPIDNLNDLFINKNITLNYLKILAIQRSRMEKRLEDYVYKDARTRVIEYILCLLRKRGQTKGHLILLKLFLTHKELAKLTSTTRQLVTTVLNDLRNKQILTFDRNFLIIKNQQSLLSEIKNQKKRLLEIQK